MRLLIVDDEPVNSLLAKRILERENTSIDEATNGEDALVLLEKNTYDCVVLDISMPGLSGDEVCAKIRANPSLKSMRVIAYTAHALTHEVEHFKSVGFDAIVTKPVSIASLTKAVYG